VIVTCGRQARVRLLTLVSSVALTLAYCAALVLDWPQWVHGVPLEWEWMRLPASFSWLWLVPAGLIAGWATWVLLYLKWRRVPLGLVLVSGVVVTGLLAYAVLVPRGDPLRIMTQAVASDDAGSFFGVGATIDDPNRFLREHIDLLDTYRQVHARTVPPGIPLLFWGASRLFEDVPRLAEVVGRHLLRVGCNPAFEGRTTAEVSGVVVQLSLPFFAGLGILPLFVLARAWFGKRAALVAAGAFPLLPGLAGFAPTFNLLYLTMALTSLWLTWEAYRRRSLRLYALNGLFLSIASFFSFGNLVLVFLDVTMIVAWVGLTGQVWSRWTRALLGCVSMLLALSTVWLIYWLGWGVSGLDMYRRVMAVHAGLGRTYWKWVLYNPYDVLAWAGVAMWPSVFYQIGSGHVRLAGLAGGYRTAFVAALLVFAVGLDLSGAVLGETARILLFLSPLFLLVGAAGAVRLGSKAVRLALIGLAVQALVSGLLMWPVTTGWRQSGFAPPRYSLPEGIQEADFALGDVIRLKGYRFDGDGVTLYWQSLRPVTAGFTVFVHLLDSQGQMAAAHDSPPQENRLPTYCWLPGEIVSDTHPVVLGPGDYDLFVGMYDWPDLERLPVSPAQAHDAIFLGRVQK